MEQRIIKNKLFTKTFSIFTLFYYSIAVPFYFIMPYILNYSKGMVYTDVQIYLDGSIYAARYFIIVFIIYLISSVLYFFETRKVDNIKVKNEKEFLEFKKRLVKFPFRINFSFIIASIIFIPILHFLAIKEIQDLTFKLVLFFMPLVILVCTASYINTKNLIQSILKRESNGTEYYADNTRFFNIGYIEILQLSFTTFLIIILVSYSYFLTLRSDTYNKIYAEEFKSLLSKQNYSSVQEVENELLKIEKIGAAGDLFLYNNNDNTYFKVIDNSGLNNNSNAEFVLSDYFIKYMKAFSAQFNGIVYMNNGSYTHGYAGKLFINGTEYYVGIVYMINDTKYLLNLVGLFFVILVTYNILVYIRRRPFKFIVNKFKGILEDKNKKHDRIPVVSDDEYGELAFLYNKLDDITYEYITNINQKQDIIEKQEQLASIGELAGGIAHDINTPISAIKSGIVMLKEMLGNFSQDQIKTLNRIDENSDKIIRIVNSMRNQIRNLGSNQKIIFNITDVVKEAQNIMYNLIESSKCTLNVSIEKEFKMLGDPPKLVLVINNLISNSIQAYNEKGGVIEIKVTKESDLIGKIEIIDYAGGLPNHIKDEIFKKIISPKEANGTGLGLYLAYSVVKGIFGGDITFVTQNGKGTTFTITLPLVKE